METHIPQREKKPNFLKALLFLIVLGVIGAGLGVAAMALRPEEGPKVATAAPIPISASVMTVEIESDFDLVESFTGLVTPRRSSALGFTTGGRVAELHVDIGDRVSEDQRLAVLDTRSLQAQLDAANAQVVEAGATETLARSTLARQRALRDQGHVSQQIVDEIAAQASAAEARLTAARAQANTLRVQIDLAEIRAPFDGVITERLVDEGVITAPGQPVLELIETGALEARIGVPSSALEGLVPGETYTLTVDGRSIEASLRTQTGIIDDRRRTVTAIFEIAEDQGAAPGAVARLPMDREISEHGLWIPLTALTEANRGLWSVLVAEPANGGWTARPRLVEIVHAEGPRAFVRGPLEDGELVILDGLQRIAPGQPVTPREESRAGAPSGVRIEDL
ncbi:MAG: efflux RND transporter periplasmic adaptor subunit [Hyphomonadaceae bacterium]|nr:efflux RND transporter periplasmic adaptor subunit [Hyphomonadaceae bacterium]